MDNNKLSMKHKAISIIELIHDLLSPAVLYGFYLKCQEQVVKIIIYKNKEASRWKHYASFIYLKQILFYLLTFSLASKS